jgi:nuclease S1
VDKIDQFAAELANPATADPERLLALKFLLHFVGDLHQPLHAADDHDAGGTKELVMAEGFTRATFIVIGISSSWSSWGLTRVK